MKELDEVTGAIVDASVRIHRELGPGLLESVYETILARALLKRGFFVERQKRIPLEYDGEVFPEAFRADLIVEHQVLVEVKSVETLPPVYAKKLLTISSCRTSASVFSSTSVPLRSRKGCVALSTNFLPPLLRVSA